MAIGLLITDLQNGGGITATVSGVDSASAWQLMTTPVIGTFRGAYSFTGNYSGTGNGATGFTLPTGYYWFVLRGLVSAVQAYSNFYYESVSDDSDPVFYRCLDAVHNIVHSLSLTGMTQDSIVLQKTPLPRDFGASLTYTKPAAIISPIGFESMAPNAGTNQRDDVIYPVLITLLADDADDQTTNFSRDLMWRQTIAREFRHAGTLAGVPECFDTTVQPLDAISLPAFYANKLWISQLRINCICRETRGTS